MHQLIDKKNKIVIYLIFLLVLSTTSNKIENYQENLPIANKITISGLSSSNDLILIKKLQNFFYINIFILKKDKINKIISEFNIVEEYNVKKVYPSKLNIEIKPAKFIAKIYDNSQLLVGSNGKLIKSETINDKLPYILGKFNSKKFLEFKKNIDLSEFNIKDFKNIIFYPSNRLDILTLDNVLIKLPEENLLKSINLAYKIINNNQFKDNSLIDLRVLNQLIIK